MILFVKKMHADSIESLPTDKNALSHSEMQIMDTLFQKKALFDTILNATKEVLIAGILFIILSLPQVDEQIKKFVPSTNTSPYILLGVKCLIFMVLFFVVKNMYLVRK
jgi:hypothetical protein